MRLAMVESRLCNSDDQHVLRRFQCTEPGSPEYAMEVQRYIRDIDVRKTPDWCTRMILDIEGTSSILAFCEFGVVIETTPEQEGAYAISYIARELSMRGMGLGSLILEAALRYMANDAASYDRTPYVMTQIAPANTASIKLFSDHGFVNEGTDPDDPDYEIWSKEFSPEKTSRLRLYRSMVFDD